MMLIQEYPVVATLLVSLIINAGFFLFASVLKTDKVTDLSYSLSFFILASILLFSSQSPSIKGNLIVTAAVMLWALRLGSYLLYRIIRIGKDYRFDDKRNDFFKFLAFWILQTLAVWIVMLPITLTLTSQQAVYKPVITVAGMGLFVIGLVIEAVADQQKFSFKQNPENRGKWIDSGLWARSRHPNYFGEILLWWGLFITVSPNLGGWKILAVIGPLFITILLLFVSGIPLLEKSAESRYGNLPEYHKYKAETPMLLPRLRKRP